MAVDIKIVVKELLKKHPVVILPRLGGFTAEYVSAEVDSNSNTFNPPHKKLDFNPDLTNDGGLIYSYLRNEEGYTDIESKKVVSDFVQNVWRRLENNLEEPFPHVGTLKLNEKKEIEFHPHVDENLLLDSYGFDSFKYAPNQKAKSKAYMAQPKVKKPRFSRALILIIGIPLLITYGVYFYIEGDPVPFRSMFGNSESSEMAIDEKDKMLEEEKAGTAESGQKKEIERELDQQTQPENALQYTEETTSGKVQTQEAEIPEDDKYAGMTQFHIIAGSFKRYQNAQVLSKKLSEKNFTPTILDKQNGYYRVAIKSFDNRNLALQEFNRLRSQHRDLKLWLLSM
jgi:hypothetical protein